MKRICIDDETIADYLEGRVKPHTREQVERHLCDCAECRELVMTGALMLHDDASIPVDTVPTAVIQDTIEAVNAASGRRPVKMSRVMENARQLLDRGRSFFSELTPGLEPQPVALRGGVSVSGGENSYMLIRLADADIRMEIDETAPARFTLDIAPARDTFLETPLTVGLFDRGEEIASATLVDRPVQFEDLPGGRFKIRFSQAGRRLAEYLLEL